jgi:hypothetical protein
MRIFNYTYTIPFNDLHKQLDYDWLFNGPHNELLGSYEGDYKRTCYQLITLIEEAIFANNLDDRAMIVFNTSTERPNCMSTLQFLHLNGIGTIIANFRSQHNTLGRPYDQEYLKWVACLITEVIDIPLNIVVNVADYHGLTPSQIIDA